MNRSTLRPLPLRALALAMTALAPLPAAAQASSDAVYAPSPVREQADRLAAQLIARMTLDEKFDQLLNTAPAIPRLGIPAYNWWTESLHGALGEVPTTNFPEPIGLAATFDTPLVHDVASSISIEVRALHTRGRETGRLGKIGTGLDTWSPNINIFRDPRWGRGQETYGEDPYLTAKMGVAFVTGMQGPNPDLPNVIATPKHFAVHSGPESTRHSANVYVSRHDLEDTYLPAFRAALVDARAQSVMCAYNRIDGQPACASDELLVEHLRGAWNFQGYVVSDCDAVKDIADNHHYAPDAAAAVAAAIRAGVDNECNTQTLGPNPPPLGERYREALNRHLITETDLDRVLTRLFAARYRNGDLPGLRSDQQVPLTAVGSQESGARALTAAEESMVLLKNDGILPLQPRMKIAVIGPLGDATRVLRGNYSSPQSGRPISVVEGLTRAMPQASVTYVPAGESITDGDPVPTDVLRAPNGKPGLLVRYYNALPDALGKDGKPMKVSDKVADSAIVGGVGAGSPGAGKVNSDHRVVWSGDLVAPETGSYRLGLSGWMSGTMTFDGKPFAELRDAPWGSLTKLTTVQLVKGRRYPIEVSADAHGSAGVGITWKRVSPDPFGDLDKAAANADVLVAVVGLTSDLEAEEAPTHIPGFEGGDKTSLDLQPDQIALLEHARATGKPLIVVAMNGSPINLSWAKENAAAILEAWYPGQSGGLAVGNVLSGKTNPAGRLPLTFYKSVDDLPPFSDYAMKGRTYRYFTGTAVYPFGYGLSYTRFDYARLKVEHVGSGIRVTTTIRNTGARAGDDVAQLYLNFPDDRGAPRIALRGFQRVPLKPGESRALTFDLSPRDLSSVDLDGIRRVLRGTYRVSIGSGQPEPGMPGQSAEFTVEEAGTLPK